MSAARRWRKQQTFGSSRIGPGHGPGCGAASWLQKHARRSERWTIVAGQGVVTLDGETQPVETGQTIDVGIGVAHRIANQADSPLVFIEIQSGQYFGEDDIVRLDDDYGRHQSPGKD